MAYVFNAVNDSLQDKANIFAPTGTSSDGDQGQQNANTFQTSAPVTGPSSGTGGGVSSPSTQPSKNKIGSGSGGSYNPAAAQKAYDTIGAGNYKPATDKISGSIAESSQKLQDEANVYTSKAHNEEAGYKVDDETLNKAANGEDKAYSTIASRLSKTQPNQFEAFEGLKTDEIPTAANAVSKPALFGDIYRPTAGSNYSAGQNALNSMQLRRSGDFRNVSQQLDSAQEKVLSDNAKMQDDLTNTTREGLGKAYTAATDEAKGKLNSMGEVIIKTAKDQEAADEARRQGLDVGQISKAEFEKMKPQLIAEAKAAGLDRSLSYFDDPNNFSDLGKYVTLDKDVDYTDFIDKAGADKYNRINGLLGNGGSIIAPTEKDADYSFDPNGAEAYIKTALQSRRQADDRALQSQIDAIQAEAAKRNASFKEDPYQDAQNYIRERYLNQNEGQTPEQIKAEEETFRQLFNPDVNGWAQHYKEEGGLSDPRASGNWQDSLSTQEAIRLSELSKQLGLDTTYKQGSLINPGFNPQYFNDLFNKNYSRIAGEIDGSTSRNSGNGIERTKTINPLADQPKTVNPIANPAKTINPIADQSEIGRLKAKYPWLSSYV